MPLGHQNGEPPRAAVAGAKSRRGNRELRERKRGDNDAPKKPRARHTGDGRQGARRRKRAPDRG